ncbi:ATP-binding protein [Candidatus Gottesmanbacteria bacterium]|nr:ATP-binding protein [Candidatus Gottesmanbacteria bacterium]
MASRYLEILNDWNFWEKDIDTGVKRRGYLDRLSYLISIGEIVAISGVRRCGKSTILRQFIKELRETKKVPFRNTLHINFEDPRFGQSLDAMDLFEIYKEYKEKLKPKGKIYLFLDEVQSVARWEKFLRTLYDLEENAAFVVTGSNSTVFSSKLSTVLTGRVIEMPVAPLSFAEYSGFSDGDFDEYLRFGGFPLVVLEKNEEKKREILISYYTDILENDVIIRNGIKNKEKVKDLALYLLSNAGNLVSSYALEKMLKISDGEVSRYLKFLEEAYLISRAPLFSYSVRKQIYNPDKVFCVDTGLANTAGFNFSENKGRALENMVFNKLSQERQRVFYWKNGAEIDFVLQKGMKVTDLINVTQTVDDEEVLQRELRALDLGQKEFSQAKTRLITLYNESKQTDPRICSLEKFLLDA